MTVLDMEFIGDVLLSDVNALMDSYALRFEIDGKVFYHAPVLLLHIKSLVGCLDRDTLTLDIKPNALEFASDRATVLTLTRHVPTPEEGDPEPKTRWPFWVDRPMLFVIAFGPLPDRVAAWAFHFQPGKQYEEMEGKSIA